MTTVQLDSGEFQYTVIAGETWVDLQDTYAQWSKLRTKLGLQGDSADSMLASLLLSFWLKYSPQLTKTKQTPAPATRTIIQYQQPQPDTSTTVTTVTTAPAPAPAPPLPPAADADDDDGDQEPGEVPYDAIAEPISSTVQTSSTTVRTVEVPQARTPAKTTTTPAVTPKPKVTKEVLQAAANITSPAKVDDQQTQMYFYDTTTGKLYPVKTTPAEKTGTTTMKQDLASTIAAAASTVKQEPGIGYMERRGRLKTEAIQHRSSEQPVHCELCEKEFSKPGNLTRHMEVVHKIVNMTSRRKMYLAKMSSRPQEPDEWPCEHCGKVFADKHRLKQHSVIHLGYKPHRCTVCNRGFVRHHELKRHMVIHDPNREKVPCPKPFECEECGKRFTHRIDLVRHETRHRETPLPGDPVKDQICDFCDKAFWKRTTLEKHYMTHSLDECAKEWPHVCKFCPKRFLYQSHLDFHHQRHIDAHAYQCEQCGRYFSSKHGLQAHEYTHQDVKPFVCNVCKRAFKTKAHLKGHMEIHSENRNHECNICNKKFLNKYRLTVHEKTHTGEARHKCDLCDKVFYLQSDFIKHKKSHEKAAKYQGTSKDGDYEDDDDDLTPVRMVKNKPFKCSTCPAAFRRKEGLTLHERNHSRAASFACDRCGKCFTRLRYMLNHQRLTTACNSANASVANVSNVSEVDLVNVSTESDVMTGEISMEDDVNTGENMSENVQIDVSVHDEVTEEAQVIDLADVTAVMVLDGDGEMIVTEQLVETSEILTEHHDQ